MADITLFILDKNKRIIDVVSNAGTEENAFWDDTFTQEINNLLKQVITYYLDIVAKISCLL